MPTSDKPPVPKKDPPQRQPPIKDPPTDPENPDVEIDVDDALIEPPRDDAFENTPDENNTTNRLKERHNLSEEVESKKRK